MLVYALNLWIISTSLLVVDCFPAHDKAPMGNEVDSGSRGEGPYETWLLNSTFDTTRSLFAEQRKNTSSAVAPEMKEENSPLPEVRFEADEGGPFERDLMNAAFPETKRHFENMRRKSRLRDEIEASGARWRQMFDQPIVVAADHPNWLTEFFERRSCLPECQIVNFDELFNDSNHPADSQEPKADSP